MQTGKGCKTYALFCKEFTNGKGHGEIIGNRRRLYDGKSKRDRRSGKNLVFFLRTALFARKRMRVERIGKDSSVRRAV